MGESTRPDHAIGLAPRNCDGFAARQERSAWRNLSRFLICISFFSTLDCQADEQAAPRTTELVRLVRQDCGSCHGLRLKGGLGPALLPESLADKPAGSLVATILGGRPGTAMPPWRGMLTEQEAEWIVARLQSGFPEE